MTTRNRKKTREKIIEGAIALLTKSGFKEFGINSVAREAGCDKVLLYRYFGDLDGLLQAIAESVPFFPEANRFLRHRLPDSDFRSDSERMSELLYAYAKELRERPLTSQLIVWSGVAENPLIQACENARKEFETALLEEGEPLEDDHDVSRQRLFSIFTMGLARDCGREDLDDREEWGPLFRRMSTVLWPSLAGAAATDIEDLDYQPGWQEEPARDEDFPFSLF